jgi:hypothetical protein
MPLKLVVQFQDRLGALETLFQCASPGTGGFLRPLAQLLHLNMSISFNALVVIGGWIGAAALVLATKGQLAMKREKKAFRSVA